MNKILGNIFKGDKVIWMVFFFLCIVSVIEVYSASAQLTYKTADYVTPMIKHIGLLAVGIGCTIVTLNINCRYFKGLIKLLLAASFVLLIVVYFIGASTNGAQRWIPIFGIQFQPSELAKGSLVLATAQILSVMQTDKGADPKAFSFILSVCALIVPLIMLENLSTAILLCIVIFMMMLIGRVPIRQLGKLMGVVLLAVALLVGMIMTFGKDNSEEQPGKQLTEQMTAKNEPDDKSVVEKVFHRFDTWKARIDKFMSHKQITPKEVDLDKDAQVAHANIAIASSNIVGKGPGNSEE